MLYLLNLLGIFVLARGYIWWARRRSPLAPPPDRPHRVNTADRDS